MPPSAVTKAGTHFETAKGEIVMDRSVATKDVREPPHWMLLWPLHPTATRIPTRPNAGGSYIIGVAHDGGFFGEFRIGGGNVPSLKMGAGYALRF